MKENNTGYDAMTAPTEDNETTRDPFTGKVVQISMRLVDRLLGKYANGPTMENGEPEFGWYQFDEVPPIHKEAAERIERLTSENERLRGALAFYRDGFSFHPGRTKTGISMSEWKPKQELLDDCGAIARAALSNGE